MQRAPEQQMNKTKELQLQLDHIKAEKETPKKEVEAKKLEVWAEKQLRIVAENSLETSTHCLNVQLFEKDTAEFEAHAKAKLLEKDLWFEQNAEAAGEAKQDRKFMTERLKWQNDKLSLLAELEKEKKREKRV